MTGAGWHDARVDVIRLQESLSTPAAVWPSSLAMAKPTSTTRWRSRERVACEGGRDRQRIPSASLSPSHGCPHDDEHDDQPSGVYAHSTLRR
jgi:hypothetical protein